MSIYTMMYLYLQDTLMKIGNYIEIVELTDGHSQATEEILDNVHWDHHNRSFGRIDRRIYVRSLTILSRPKLGIPKHKTKQYIKHKYNKLIYLKTKSFQTHIYLHGAIVRIK